MDPRRVLPALTALACALAVATVVVTLARSAPSPPDRVKSEQGGAAAGGERGGDRGGVDRGVHRGADRGVDGGVHRGSPAAVLAAWDARRSQAWAEGDGAGLAGLYADGSRTGRADVRLLRHYRERGLRVEGLTTQVLSLGVLERGPHRLVLVVTDRVAGGVAVGGAVPVTLPRDRASTRRVVLTREPGRPWQVDEVRDAGVAQESAAANTSRTSSSSKS